MAASALAAREIVTKLAAVEGLARDWRMGALPSGDAHALDPDRLKALLEPGRPARPHLVGAQDLPRRRGMSTASRIALIHALAHIEFNAINLALDCIARFPDFPQDYYNDWVRVAEEEALHFGLLRQQLQNRGADYGDLPAHDALWEMACRTHKDALARMALVPRVLEARGLDAAPVIIEKLQRLGEADLVTVMEIILRDEEFHVAVGDRWFRHLCRGRGLDAGAEYLRLVLAFNAPWPAAPINLAARRRAGFSDAELKILSGPRPQA
ncbi:MAG: ferritin-like domain-containing protein [Zoogloeaceae bacterium]|nr:ferritin-like domain-containing protein [Zoogloeaceae bacterium]